MIPVCCLEVMMAEELRHCHHLPFTIVVGAFERQEGLLYLCYMSHSQMLGKVEYGLPAKIWRLVGCTEMLS